MDYQMKKILELASSVADKIAAGEVVSRPLSIVKELVENSIDAGASSIVIEIKNGGKTYLRVTDNGSGIVGEDVELAFKRHATSKITTDKDLDEISTLGFRGEALTSIAAVSKTQIITKTREQKTGVRLDIEAGIVKEKSDVGAPDGTTIIVTDLFYNTPARLKFLKQDHTESTMIIDFISKMTLAYPSIKIRLINNGNILFSTSGRGDVLENILTVYSDDIGKNLIHITEINEDGISLDAYISQPSFNKPNRRNQIYFVNGRNISSKLLEDAVSDGYMEKLPEGRYPVAFIFIKMPPNYLDVNIHPNKKEVQFYNERVVRVFVAGAIFSKLDTKRAISEINETRFDNPTINIQTNNEKTVQQSIWKASPDTLVKWIPTSEKEETILEEVEQYNGETEEIIPQSVPITAINDNRFSIEDLQITGNIFHTYITAVDWEYFYLIDQHAAHERIFYENFINQYKNDEKMPQLLLAPFVVHVSFAVKEETQSWIDFLHNAGFEIEEFGTKAYVVKAIPIFMELVEAERFLDDFLDTISDTTDFSDQNKIDKIISKACKNAVKAHDILDMSEMRQLLKDLSKTRNPYTCPHGRPVFIKLGRNEIEKMFKRT